MTNSELKRAALSAAQGMSAEEAFEQMLQGVSRSAKMSREFSEIACSTLEAMGLAYAAYALLIGSTAEDLTDIQKKQAMLNWALDKEGE